MVRQRNSPILHVFDTSDQRGVMVNLSGTERWRELCRLSASTTVSSITRPRRACRGWPTRTGTGQLQEFLGGVRGKTADEWEAALLEQPAPVAKCNTLAEWLATSRRASRNWWSTRTTRRWGGCRWWARRADRGRFRGNCGTAAATEGEHGASAAPHRGPVELLGRTMAARLLAELGAKVVKVEPPGGEGAFQVMPVLPNIYVDGNRSKRGLVLDLKAAGDRRGCSTWWRRPTSWWRTPWRGVGAARPRRGGAAGGEPGARVRPGQGLRHDGAAGVSRPTFDYVVQAATGMEMTQGGGARPVPVNVVVNDYGTGLVLAGGSWCARCSVGRGVWR